uniref:Uncharacterized protein n=1 Tax=Solanum tuberosum TaxID=4113 RepID=M0ZMN5_SOLTU
MVNNGHWVIGDVAGSISSGKEIILADQETHNSDFELWVSNVAAINGDQLTTSRGKEVVGANQEKCNSDFEFWGSVEINGDAMAAEFWAC